MTELMEGAEPFSAAGSGAGVLVLHGFTSNPASMRGVALAVADAGFTVELPRLPGHGTSIEEMLQTRWADWSAHAEATYDELAARCESVVVVGLSMGGSLATWLTVRHPEIAGLVCINAAIRPQPDEIVEAIRAEVDAGNKTFPGVGSDIADPDVVESAYELAPLLPLLSLIEALDSLQDEVHQIACPVLILTSPQDHVVDPGDSDFLAGAVAGPVERVTLDRSYHVATQDYDKEIVFERTVEFANKVS